MVGEAHNLYTPGDEIEDEALGAAMDLRRGAVGSQNEGGHSTPVTQEASGTEAPIEEARVIAGKAGRFALEHVFQQNGKTVPASPTPFDPYSLRVTY